MVTLYSKFNPPKNKKKKVKESNKNLSEKHKFKKVFSLALSTSFFFLLLNFSNPTFPFMGVWIAYHTSKMKSNFVIGLSLSKDKKCRNYDILCCDEILPWISISQ